MVGYFSQDQFSRILHLIRVLQDQQAVTPQSLAEQLVVPEEIIYQDLDKLNSAGVPVYLSPSGCRVLPSFPSSMPFFSMEESMLLTLGLSLLVKDGVLDKQKFCSLRSKIALSAVEPVGKSLSPTKGIDTPLSNPVAPAIMVRVNEAIQRKQRVVMNYRSRNHQNPGIRELSPYTLVYRKDAWYVIGFCHRHNEIRTFKISRIEEIAPSSADFYQDTEFDIDEFLMYRWYIMGGEPYVVIVRFDQEVGPLILEKNVSHGSVWEEDGVVYLQTLVSGLEEFSWWIMQYGEHAEVLQPRELRRILAKRCTKMGAMYSKTLLERSRRVKR